MADVLDVLIVGGGAAGYTAGIFAARDRCRALLLEKFSSGGQVLNSRAELRSIYESGQGTLKLRGEYELEEGARGARTIIVTSIPYGIDKANLVEKIADVIIGRKLATLVDVRDEGRQRMYRLNPGPLKPIHDWVKKYEQSWSERFDRMDVVLAELKDMENGDSDDE